MLVTLRRHRIACFLVVTFAVTWGAWIPMAIAGRGVTVGFEPRYLLGLLGPLIGAVVTTALVDGRHGLRELATRMLRVRVGLRWWAFALVLPLAVAAVSYLLIVGYSVFLLAPVELPSSARLGQFNGFPVTGAALMLVMLIAVNGFGEETGWRGFLLPQLQRHRRPLTASLVVALVWALWHVPAFFVTETYRLMPRAMIPMFFVGLVSGSIYLAWLYNRGRKSIFLVAVWHGTFNLVSGSVGARGSLAAVESTIVMVIAGILVIRELRADRRERRLVGALHTMPAGS